MLIYREPRPFWTKEGLRTIYCQASFTGPNYNQFMATLIMLYSIIELKKYQILKTQVSLYILVGLFSYLSIMTLVFNIMSANNFIYQNILGVIIAIIIIILFVILDNSISVLCLKLGFFVKSSKKYKFIFLIVLLLLFSICMAFALIVEENTLIQSTWVLNYKVNLFYYRNLVQILMKLYQMLLVIQRLIWLLSPFL